MNNTATAPGVELPHQPGHETWHNNATGPVYIYRFGAYGVVEHERIAPGADFMVTPDERRKTQTKAAIKAQDVFTNGTFSPVFLLPEEHDTPALLANPNNITRDEFEGIFKLRGQNFVERIEVVTSLPTIDSLIDRALDPANKVLVEQYQFLQARRARIIQENAPVMAEPVTGSTGERVPKPSAIH